MSVLLSSKRHEVTDVEGEENPTLRCCARQLGLIIGIRRYPAIRRARDVMPALKERLLDYLARRIGVEMQLGGIGRHPLDSVQIGYGCRFRDDGRRKKPTPR